MILLPVCPPKLNSTSLLQSAVFISDAGMSPGVLQSCPLLSRFNISDFKPAVMLSVQRLDPARWPAPCSRARPVCIFISPSFVHKPTVKRARTHTDAVVYVSRVFMLFIVWSIAFTKLCSNRCRFIYYDKNFHCESCRFSKLYLLSLFGPRPSVRLSRPPQQHCMWLMNGRSESLSSREEGFNTLSKCIVEIFENVVVLTDEEVWGFFLFVFYCLQQLYIFLYANCHSPDVTFTSSISQTQTCL